ncbi:hypothetical protein [Chimaeribacter coloradensis]|uniref:hypothetical protein n=1 Tax=Chimaeribacter coloradensis TaxID=2060068 RepID=UPI0013FD0871|nr:hypothetical protein [Chimaeribacter coloradensis]
MNHTIDCSIKSGEKSLLIMIVYYLKNACGQGEQSHFSPAFPPARGRLSTGKRQ